jgi:phosphocarrier protein FPr
MTVTVANPLGIHARPAAKIVSTAARYRAQTRVKNLSRDSGWAEGASINQLTLLDARQGDQLLLRASGPEAEQALQSLHGLISLGFGELEPDGAALAAVKAPSARAAAPDILPEDGRVGTGWVSGVAISPGYAVGPAVRYHRVAAAGLCEQPAAGPQVELARLDAAIREVDGEYDALGKQLAARGRAYEAEIFAALGLYLHDPGLNQQARESIVDRQATAQIAWRDAADRLISSHVELGDQRSRERGVDLTDIRDRVLDCLLGTGSGGQSLDAPSILLARELSPADVMHFDPGMVLGLCTNLGNVSSHTAIIARALGIPAVCGLEPDTLHLLENRLIALDGNAGAVLMEPGASEKKEIEERRSGWLRDTDRQRERSLKPSMTVDGRRVEVRANVMGLIDAQAALRSGAEGIGLLRTELFFQDRLTAPGEDEQLEAYRSIAGLFQTRPTVVRTFDLGADKILPYLPLEPGANPALGIRGVRVYRKYPELFETQLRAILRAAREHLLSILIPAVTSVEEVRFIKATLQKVTGELRRRGISSAEDIAVGMMVEIPSAAILADKLAAESDFFSIGTNDLCQYTLAIDRSDPAPDREYDYWQPAVLLLIDRTVTAAHDRGISAGICGEMAGDPEAVPLLVGLGLDQLSMNADSIAAVKQKIATISYEQAKKTVRESLELDSARAVRQLFRQRFGGDIPL